MNKRDVRKFSAIKLCAATYIVHNFTGLKTAAAEVITLMCNMNLLYHNYQASVQTYFFNLFYARSSCQLYEIYNIELTVTRHI